MGDVPGSREPGVSGQDRAVIFETMKLGDTQRVAAIDVATGVEVVVIAPSNAAEADVRALAMRKLERALAGEGEAGDPPQPPRPGKLV